MKLSIVAALVLALSMGAMPAYAKGSKGKSSHSSRGGHYTGGKGSSHKNGHYKNKKTNDHYQKRKK